MNKPTPKFDINDTVLYKGMVYIIQHIEIVGKEVYVDIYFGKKEFKNISEKELKKSKIF